jgi:hypothetical protein
LLCCDQQSLELSQVLISPVNLEGFFRFICRPVFSLGKPLGWRLQRSLEFYNRFCLLVNQGHLLFSLSAVTPLARFAVFSRAIDYSTVTAPPSNQAVSDCSAGSAHCPGLAWAFAC